MQALVRTPDQHVLMVIGNPHNKPSNRTCLQVAGLQEHANTPGEFEMHQTQTRLNRNFLIK